MQHLAIDLGGKESQICVRDVKEQILEERRLLTKRLGEFLAKQPPSRVILATSAEAFAVADLPREQARWRTGRDEVPTKSRRSPDEVPTKSRRSPDEVPTKSHRAAARSPRSP